LATPWWLLPKQMSLRDRLINSASAPGVRAPAKRMRGLEVMTAGRWHRPPLERRTRIVAVGGGTGGVGKSAVASNLAVAIASLGRDVVLVDLDLESPQLHQLFGIERPVPGLRALLDNQISSFDGSLTATGIRNLHLIAGGDGDSCVLRLDRQQKRFLMRQIHELDSEVVVVDIGSRDRTDLLDFFAVGGVRVVVSTSNQAALESAYAFLKGATKRAVTHIGDTAQALTGFSGALIGNMSVGASDTERFHAFARLVEEHLGIRLPVLGCLPINERVAESARRHRPLLAGPGMDDTVRMFHQMAEHLMSEEVSLAPACDLAGSAVGTFIDEPLPAPLGVYMRRHPRLDVNWMATLIMADRAMPVRVLDLSQSGVGLEVLPGLVVGDRGTLRFEQLPGQPALDVVIRNLQSTLSRAGVAFLADESAIATLLAAGRAPRQ
jgi:MinD-like ATPase involved in chromosome partitioning or flagellar assembly